MFTNLQIKILPLEIRLRRKWAEAKEQLSMDWNCIIVELMDHNTFWTYSIDGAEYYDGEFETMKKAEAAANEDWETYCEENGDWRNGETSETDVELVLFFYDEKTGERRIMQRENSVVYFEYYHGDYAEHFRQSDYL